VRNADHLMARRTVSVLVLATLGLALAPAAHAVEKETVVFTYGTDRRTWYWERQKDEEVTVPVPPGTPVEPSQRVRIPNPQRNDTLPVAIFQGDPERMSALYVDLVSRGVTEGSTINTFKMTIEESQDKNEQPSFKPADAEIEACRIDEIWPDSDGGEEWGTRPDVSGSECVDGKRDTKGQVPTWTFDLKPIAAEWGEDPFQNYGVMLQPNLKNAEDDTTWQVNLKIPSRDNANTPDDEYNQTKKRLVVDLAFVPGVPEDIGGSFDTGTGSYSGSTGSFGSGSTSFGSTGGSSFGSTGTSPVISGSGDTSGDTATEAPGTTPVATTQAPSAPKLPPYVWLLIPVGLLALAAVRSVVLEPVGGTRPDGVIAAIRRRNIERRGAPLRELTDPLSRFAAASRGVMNSMRRGLHGAGKGISSVFKRGRKS
jgi:hypothetical protein